jgi:hypothetical protein
MGHPAYVMMYPILDLAVFGSDDAVLLFHSEARAASTQHSIPSWFGFMIKPLSFVPSKNLPIIFTAAVCCIFGLAQCLAHWWLHMKCLALLTSPNIVVFLLLGGTQNP